MADAKPSTKKSATPAPKTVADMRTELAAKQADMIVMKRSHKAGELVNPRALTAARKEIARLQTAIRASELQALKEDK